MNPCRCGCRGETRNTWRFQRGLVGGPPRLRKRKHELLCTLTAISGLMCKFSCVRMYHAIAIAMPRFSCGFRRRVHSTLIKLSLGDWNLLLLAEQPVSCPMFRYHDLESSPHDGGTQASHPCTSHELPPFQHELQLHPHWPGLTMGFNCSGNNSTMES